MLPQHDTTAQSTSTTKLGDEIMLRAEQTNGESLDPIPNLDPPSLEKVDRLDGGPKAYLAAVGTFFATFATFGLILSFGNFQVVYQDNQLHDKSPSDIAWIGTVQLWFFSFSGAFAGGLFDVYGTRPLIGIGTILFTASNMLTSVSKEYYQFMLCQGVLGGIGAGFIYYPALSSLPTHFCKYKATAVGIAYAGTGIGGVVFPLILGNLLPSIGFGWAVRVAGFIALVCCIIAFAAVQRRVSDAPKAVNCFELASFTDAKFVVLAIATSLSASASYVPGIFIAQYAEDVGISSRGASEILSIVNAGTIVGSLFPTVVGDRIGRFNTTVPCGLLSAVFCLVLWLPSRSFLSVAWFAALWGIFSGGFWTLAIACVATISKEERVGTRIGMIFALNSFPTLVGGPIAGALLSKDHGNYIGMIMFVAVIQLFSTAIVAYLRWMVNPKLLARV